MFTEYIFVKVLPFLVLMFLFVKVLVFSTALIMAITLLFLFFFAKAIPYWSWMRSIFEWYCFFSCSPHQCIFTSIFSAVFFMWEFNLSVRILITPLLWLLKPKFRSMFITEPSTNRPWTYPRKTTLSKLVYSNEMCFFRLLSWIVCILF